jgi:hypothetical protein
MNSQKSKASGSASGTGRTLKRTRQASKSLTNASSTSSSAPAKKRRRLRGPRGGRDLQNTFMGTGSLRLSSSNLSRVRKTHLLDEDEYIADVAGSVAFAVTGYPINIGQSSTFPWGSKIAQLYEKYEFISLEFYYRREVSEFATNGQAGKLMLSLDYDAADAAPTTKQQVLDTEPHVDGMPCIEELVLRVDCRQMRRQDGCYVRPGIQPVNTDIKTYDCGNFFASTYGNTNTSTIGELRVRYKCLLSVPILEPAAAPPAGQPGSYLQITSNLLGEAAAATTVYVAQFVSTTTPSVMANGIGATLGATGAITLLAGSYLIECNSISSDTAANVTASTIAVSNVVTANTGILGSSGGYGSTDSFTAEVSTFTNTTSAMAPFIWNTVQYGTNLAVQVKCTYAAGAALNQTYLKITQL